MDDNTFEQLRDGLAPDRDTTSRLGALYLLELELDDDDRLPSLLSTLLRDRSPEVVGATAALCHNSAGLSELMKRDLDRVWSTGSPETRHYMLPRLSPDGLARRAMDFARIGDAAIGLALLERLVELEEPGLRRDVALWLSRDNSDDVRASATAVLAELAHEFGDVVAEGASIRTGVRAAALRLANDDSAAVRRAAAAAVAIACEGEEARTLLIKLANDSDIEVRSDAAKWLRSVQERINRAAVEPLVERQRELVDAGEYDRAMGVGAQVFMRVADHGGCQYQLARAAAGMGDVRRSLHLLIGAFHAGFDGLEQALADPLLEAARQTEAWTEVLEVAAQAREQDLPTQP